MKKEYNLKLDAGQYGYFVTEWVNLFAENEKREDLPRNVKEAIGLMYARLIIQLEEQNMENYKNIQDNKLYDEIYTDEEFVRDLMLYCEKEIVFYSNYINKCNEGVNNDNCREKTKRKNNLCY